MKTLFPGLPYEVGSECTSATAESTLQRQQQKCVFILNWSEWLICKSQATAIDETCEMPFGHPSGVMFLGCRTFHNQVLVQWGIFRFNCSVSFTLKVGWVSLQIWFKQIRNLVTSFSKDCHKLMFYLCSCI